MENKIIEFKKLIDKSERILLINHIKMDPDAFGSLGTFYYILEKIGKTVKAVNDMNPPKSFNFLNSSEIINPNLNLNDYNPDLIISFDAASTGQLGETYTDNIELFKKTDFVVIDHHMTNKGFGTLNIIDANKSSTCELVLYLLEKMNLDGYLTSKEATLLTCGIHTDTNIFYNSNTSSDTLRSAAKLMDLGADFRSSMFHFFQSATYEKTKLYGEVFNNIGKSEDGKIIWCKITDEMFNKTGTTTEDTDGIINRIINIEGCEVAFIIYQIGNISKASLRSKSFSVGDFCANFPNGGGHKLAAGFRIEKNLDETEKEIVEKLKKDLN